MYSLYPHLWVGHVLVDHLHLGVDVVSLLVLIQRPVVPHQQLECRVKRTHVVRASQPCRLVRGQAVATVRVAGGNNKHIRRNDLSKEMNTYTHIETNNNTHTHTHTHLSIYSSVNNDLFEEPKT